MALSPAPGMDVALHATESVRRRYPGLVGVVLFGSVARGEAVAGSDVDLLVIGEGDLPTRRSLMAGVPHGGGSNPLALAIIADEDFQGRLSHGDAFLEHVADEGLVLWEREGRVTRALTTRKPPTRRQIRYQLDRELSKLSYFDDLSQFNGLFDLCCAQLFAIGKAVIILRLMLDGQKVFARQAVFTELRRQHPELAKAIAHVVALEPYWAHASRHTSGYVSSAPATERTARSALTAIREIGLVVP